MGVRITIDVEDLPDNKEAQPDLECIIDSTIELIGSQLGYNIRIITIIDEGNCDIYDTENKEWHW